ncbi:MAG: hypothetical protein IMF01_05105, partial [Proteobacteria bacterium]|nr:hypothetical protein [Pseudomonadota bacterium]
MRYRPYRLNMEVIARIIRKTKAFKLPKVKNLNTMQKALAWTYKNSGAKLGDMEAIIHAEEYYWLSGDKTVYFPESAEMADNIMRGSYTIQSEEALYDGAESFIINLPSG